MRDAVRVREVAYRSAQILAITRKYPYNLPQEAFSSFHVGAVLWCIADLLRQDDVGNQLEWHDEASCVPA